MSATSENLTKSAFSIFDTMLQMQRLGMRAITMYQPVASAFVNSTTAAQSSSLDRTRSTVVHDKSEEQVIGLGEEVLNVGTRMVPGKTTRVRRVVVQAPVQQEVTLHTETVIVEHRRPISTTTGEVLTEVIVEMSDFNEVPVVSKAVRLVEEVLVRKEITARTETIHETVRRDTLEVEQPSQLPVVFGAAPKQDEAKRTAENAEKHLAVVPAPVENKAADQKRPQR